MHRASCIGLLLLLHLSLGAQSLLYNGGALLFVQENAVLRVEGDVKVADESGMPGRIALDGDLQVFGDFINESSDHVFDGNDRGRVYFKGMRSPLRIGGDHPTKFPRLYLALDSAGGLVHLEQMAWCYHWLDLGDDVIDLREHELVLLSGDPEALQRDGGIAPPFSGSVEGGYLQNGVLVRSLQGGNSAPYLFPLGNNGTWRPLLLSAELDASTWYAARFLELPSPMPGARDTSLLAVNPTWHHSVQRRLAETGPVSLQVFYDPIPDEVCDPEQATLASLGPTAWNPYPQVSGTPGAGSSLASLRTRLDSVPLDESLVSVAARAEAEGAPFCVFPPEQVLLTAIPGSDYVDLLWESDSEQAGDQFILERSDDSQNFAERAVLPAALLLPPPHSYAFSDSSLLPNQSYFYRVRQVDINGDFRLSNVVEVLLPGDEPLVIGEFYPNPTRDKAWLSLGLSESMRVQSSIYNPVGQLIRAESQSLSPGIFSWEFDFSGLAKGVFLVKIQAGQTIRYRKIVVH